MAKNAEAVKEKEVQSEVVANDQNAGSLVEVKNTLPAEAINFYDDAGAGTEGVDSNSVAIPFITVLQGLSPQMETVEGAKVGLICNTVTNELHKEVLFVPCAFQRKFLRWQPRSAGGGFRGEMSVVEYERLKQSNQLVLNEKNIETYEGDEIRDTRIHFGLLLTEDGIPTPVVMSLSSTNIKVSKRFMAMICGVKMRGPNGKVFNPPSYSHVYRLSSEKTSNEKGTWYLFKIDQEKMVSDPDLYAAARSFYQQVTSGEAVASLKDSVPDMDGGGESSEEF